MFNIKAKNWIKLVMLSISLLMISFTSKAQIENLIVETYYISDANDATDTTGGYLEAGSVTYRIYIDLLPGSTLKKIYGDNNHPLRIASTGPFFNNKADGESFGKDFSKNRLRENTVALDSWLTLGQTTRVSSTTCFGVLKRMDDNGSFVGGTNSDGGSQSIPAGLINNNDAAAGIPVTVYDGHDTMAIPPNSWADYGFIDSFSNTDSTIFGSLKSGSEFISNNAGLQCSGVSGVNPDSNYVLVAQLTTRGEISFELNLEVEEHDSSGTRLVKYVADGNILMTDERVCPFLKYPQACGCTDPQYLEYSPAYACMVSDSCRTLIVLGCMDTLACNFDPAANFNVSEICCYPGYCNDRDINVVCPQLSAEKLGENLFEIYPNPASQLAYIKSYLKDTKKVSYTIYDSYGRLMFERKLGSVSGTLNDEIDVSLLAGGVYLLRIDFNDESETKIFIKQ